MQKKSIKNTLLEAWKLTINNVINKNETYSGKEKELRVSNDFEKQILKLNPNVQIIKQKRFESWEIDLVVVEQDSRTAIEIKYKLVSDGAVPDNRKEIFYDLYKIEKYINSLYYSTGAFFFLTNDSRYLNTATGDSRDFSTHNQRFYKSKTQLVYKRARRIMPSPFILENDYCFSWESYCDKWYSLYYFIS